MSIKAFMYEILANRCQFTTFNSAEREATILKAQIRLGETKFETEREITPHSHYSVRNDIPEVAREAQDELIERILRELVSEIQDGILEEGYNTVQGEIGDA